MNGSKKYLFFVVFFLLFFAITLFEQIYHLHYYHPPNNITSLKCAYPPLEHYSILPDKGKVCVLVRTYTDQLLKTHPYSLYRLMDCLNQMEYTNWQALFFATDENPIPEINEILKKKNETRFKHVDMTEYLHPYEDYWYGYDITDEAVKRCPSDSRWLLVTNGDNEYSPKTFNYLNESYDGIYFNFYSRHFVHVHPTPQEAEKDPEGETRKLFQYTNEHLERHNISEELVKKMIYTPCPDCHDRYLSSFPDEEDVCYSLNAKNCFLNLLAPVKTDLGAAIWNFQRWQKENRNFNGYSPNCCHDGFLSLDLLEAGWSLKQVPICFFSHSPNLWSACRHLIVNGGGYTS